MEPEAAFSILGIAPADWGTIVAGLAAAVALVFSGWANMQVARHQSLQNTYDFLDKFDEYTDALRKAQSDPVEHKRQVVRTLNFLDATCHGINRKLFPSPARRHVKENVVKIIAAIEDAGLLQLPQWSGDKTHSEIARFVDANRASIQDQIAQFKKLTTEPPKNSKPSSAASSPTEPQSPKQA